MEPENQVCSTWNEIAECLGRFRTRVEYNPHLEEINETEWVFRGDDSWYELKPTIERTNSGIEWFALEHLVSNEFKARARAHLAATMIPKDDDEFTWLALMQHYGVPTRLLDFTYSPFVALYFAMRNGLCSEKPKPDTKPEPDTERRPGYIRVWAVNARAVKERFQEVAWEAFRQIESSEEKERIRPSFNPYTFSDDLDGIKGRDVRQLISRLLLVTGPDRKILQRHLNKKGCVCVGYPPSFNPRLVNQQGAFLFNFAEGLSLGKSLTKMMEGRSKWVKTFDIPTGLTASIDHHLFQMNIHEQSLFPDMEGLARFIWQKIRLQWTLREGESGEILA